MTQLLSSPLGHLVLAPLAFSAFLKHMLIKAFVLTCPWSVTPFPQAVPSVLFLQSRSQLNCHSSEWPSLTTRSKVSPYLPPPVMLTHWFHLLTALQQSERNYFFVCFFMHLLSDPL